MMWTGGSRAPAKFVPAHSGLSRPSVLGDKVSNTRRSTLWFNVYEGVLRRDAVATV